MELRWLALALALALVAGGAAPPRPVLVGRLGAVWDDPVRGDSLDDVDGLPPHAQRSSQGELPRRDGRRAAERLLAIPAALGAAPAARCCAIVETAARAAGLPGIRAAPRPARGPPRA